MLEDQISTILEGNKVSRSLTLHFPASLDDEKQNLVKDICSMAIAGVAVKTACDLLESHKIEGVVLTTS
jgi:hypothetical protein